MDFVRFLSRWFVLWVVPAYIVWVVAAEHGGWSIAVFFAGWTMGAMAIARAEGRLDGKKEAYEEVRSWGSSFREKMRATQGRFVGVVQSEEVRRWN